MDGCCAHVFFHLEVDEVFGPTSTLASHDPDHPDQYVGTTQTTVTLGGTKRVRWKKNKLPRPKMSSMKRSKIFFSPRGYVYQVASRFGAAHFDCLRLLIWVPDSRRCSVSSSWRQAARVDQGVSSFTRSNVHQVLHQRQHQEPFSKVRPCEGKMCKMTKTSITLHCMCKMPMHFDTMLFCDNC